MSTTIRTVAIGISLVSLLQLGLTVTAFAQGPGAAAPGSVGFTLTFDEQGNSLLNGGPNPNQVQLVAGGGIDFFLPVPVIPGFVLVSGSSDVNTANPNGISDLLTFSNTQLASGQTVGVMNYQSLIDDIDPNNDPADVPTLQFTQPVSTVNEIGPEGNNGFTWIPDPPNPAGSVYVGISDGVVPEPTSIVLGGLGMISLIAVGWRQRRLAAA